MSSSVCFFALTTVVTDATVIMFCLSAVDVVRGKVITKRPEVMEKVSSKGMRYVLAYDGGK